MAEAVADREPVRRPDDPFDELRAPSSAPSEESCSSCTRICTTPPPDSIGRDCLPDAFALRAKDPKLSGAIAPMIEDAITASVRKNPQPLADALFPVIGPAIRKAISTPSRR